MLSFLLWQKQQNDARRKNQKLHKQVSSTIYFLFLCVGTCRSLSLPGSTREGFIFSYYVMRPLCRINPWGFEESTWALILDWQRSKTAALESNSAHSRRQFYWRSLQQEASSMLHTSSQMRTALEMKQNLQYRIRYDNIYIYFFFCVSRQLASSKHW